MTVLDGFSERCEQHLVASSGPDERGGVEPTLRQSGQSPGGRAPSARPPTLLTLLLAVVIGAGVGWSVGGLAANGLPAISVGAQLAMLVLGAWLAALGTWALVTWARRRVVLVDATGVELAAAAPLLAHVRAPEDLTLLPALDPGSTESGTFMPLRRAVERQIGLPRPLLAVVAGPGRDETPVWVGANLAIALAQAGRKVLLVDARPPSGAAPDMPDVPGLAGLLAGIPLAEATSPGPVVGLEVLPPGVVADRAASEHSQFYDAVDLLGPVVAPALAAAASGFEVVVVVGPPLQQRPARATPARAERSSSSAGTPDAGAADAPAGAGLLVLAISAGRTRATEVRQQVERIRGHGNRVLGAVLVAGGSRRG